MKNHYKKTLVTIMLSTSLCIQGGVLAACSSQTSSVTNPQGQTEQATQDETPSYTTDDLVQAYADGDAEKVSAVTDALGLSNEYDLKNYQVVGLAQRIMNADAPEDDDCVTFVRLISDVSQWTQDDSDSANTLRGNMSAVVSAAQKVIHLHGECLSPSYEAFRRWSGNLGVNSDLLAQFMDDPSDGDVMKIEKELVQQPYHAFNLNIREEGAGFIEMARVQNDSDRMITGAMLWTMSFSEDGKAIPCSSLITAEPHTPQNWAIVESKLDLRIEPGYSDDIGNGMACQVTTNGGVLVHASAIIASVTYSDGTTETNPALQDWTNFYTNHSTIDDVSELPCCHLSDGWIF